MRLIPVKGRKCWGRQKSQTQCSSQSTKRPPKPAQWTLSPWKSPDVWIAQNPGAGVLCSYWCDYFPAATEIWQFMLNSDLRVLQVRGRCGAVASEIKPKDRWIKQAITQNEVIFNVIFTWRTWVHLTFLKWHKKLLRRFWQMSIEEVLFSQGCKEFWNNN